MEIRVLKVTPIERSGNLKGFASVRIGDIEIGGFRIIEQPGQRAWQKVPEPGVGGDAGTCPSPSESMV